MNTFDTLPQGEQRRILTAVVAAAAQKTPEMAGYYMKVGKISTDEITSVLASTRLWNGYQAYQALAKPETGLHLDSGQVQQVKRRIEWLLVRVSADHHQGNQ